MRKPQAQRRKDPQRNRKHQFNYTANPLPNHPQPFPSEPTKAKPWYKRLPAPVVVGFLWLVVVVVPYFAITGAK